MDYSYYILRNNQQEGPFTAQTLLSLDLPPQTLVWREGWVRWLPLQQIEELRMVFEGTAPLPATVSEKASPETSQREKVYYLATGNAHIGRFTLEELMQDVAPLRQAQWVWYEGLAEWIAVLSVPELTALLIPESAPVDPIPPLPLQEETPPPIPPTFAKPSGDAPYSPFDQGVEEHSLWEYFILCITKRFAQFSGRARRREFWGFFLFSLIFNYALQIISSVTLLPSALSDVLDAHLDVIPSSIDLLGFYSELFSHPAFLSAYGLSFLLQIVFLIPHLSVAVRRMHDIGKSGWFILISLIPVVGWIIFIVYAAQEGERYTNKYGEDPKAPRKHAC